MGTCGTGAAILCYGIHKEGKEHYAETYFKAKDDLEKLTPGERKKYINSRLKMLGTAAEEELSHPGLTRWLDVTNPARALANLGKEYGVLDKNWNDAVKEYRREKYRIFS